MILLFKRKENPCIIFLKKRNPVLKHINDKNPIKFVWGRPRLWLNRSASPPKKRQPITMVVRLSWRARNRANRAASAANYTSRGGVSHTESSSTSRRPSAPDGRTRAAPISASRTWSGWAGLSLHSGRRMDPVEASKRTRRDGAKRRERRRDTRREQQQHSATFVLRWR